MRRHLIIYAKRPLPGHAKTRLAASIGDEAAAGVYMRLLCEYLLALTSADFEHISIELSVAEADDVPFFTGAFPELAVRPQVEGDLGTRMETSFRQAFESGAETAVLTGTDIPGLNRRTVEEAFCKLEEVPVVIGPAEDGGYYLIGMRAPGAPLFYGVAWSSERVLAQTEALASNCGLEIGYLPRRWDVDTEADFERWQKELCGDQILSGV